MIASLFAALVLAQADAAPAATAVAPAPASAIAAAPSPDYPKGAPTDDYGLVAWCRGALTGHMALYTLVRPELQSIAQPGELAQQARDDKAQMQAGQDYLALYRRAMLAAEKASPQPLHHRGLVLEGQGRAIWTAAEVAPARQRMWTWLMWDLPGQCEIAAKRLQTRSGLLGEALSNPSGEAPVPAASAGSAPQTPQ